MSVNAEGYRNESFESLESAVMETPRGRWFLEEYSKRQRSEESLAILEILRGLEKSIINSGSSLNSQKAVVAKPINQEQLKFFKKDEEIFAESIVVPPPALSVVSPVAAAEVKLPTESKGAKLKIQRVNSTEMPEEPIITNMIPDTLAPPTKDAETVADAASIEPKQRIVIIRRPASEVSEIPMVDENKAEVAA
jgi:hypothetical protein